MAIWDILKNSAFASTLLSLLTIIVWLIILNFAVRKWKKIKEERKKNKVLNNPEELIKKLTAHGKIIDGGKEIKITLKDKINKEVKEDPPKKGIKRIFNFFNLFKKSKIEKIIEFEEVPYHAPRSEPDRISGKKRKSNESNDL